MLRFIIYFFMSASVYANTVSFDEFLQNIYTKAREQNISKKTLDEALSNLTLDTQVIKYDRNQAEFSQNFWHYINSRVSQSRFRNGIYEINKNKKILKKMHQQYGIPPHILIALCGLESNYGKNVGNFNIIRSLATLSFDKRRSQFFKNQLFILLKLIDDGKIPLNVQGSWAGAMGQIQFIPENVANYGVDANNNNKLEIWNESEEIFASAANFLKHIGWHRGETWGQEVSLEKQFDYKLANLNIKKNLYKWRALGVKTANGNELTGSKVKASVILPMGHEGPAFLVYRNFQAILNWNNSILYALSVGILADSLAGSQPLIAKTFIEQNLNKNNVKHIQTTLNQLGFNSGKPDGIIGPKTSKAVRAYQQANNLIVDGYVGYKLWTHIK